MKTKLLTLGFLIGLTLAAFRAYQYPEYTSDGLLYMANAVVMKGASVQALHDTVYRDASAGMPRRTMDHLEGKDDPIETPQSKSFKARALNPYRFAEFLPCFAIRPIFNELVYLLHYKIGMGLLRATVLIPVLSYWLLGWIVLAWISHYVAQPWPPLISLLLLLTPPIWDLARSNTPDAFSCCVLLLSLYLILEKESLLLGLSLVLASVYIRTDNVLLVLPLLASASLAHKSLEKAKAACLAGLAIGSVILINHFAGDYGIKMLYYRAFVEPPVAPGELVAQFGLHDYLVAFQAGISTMTHGPVIPFALMGLVGTIACLRTHRVALLGLVAVTLCFAVSHFLVFPLGESRYFGLFFLVMGIMAASTLTVIPEDQKA
jgi:hypothetical protein